MRADGFSSVSQVYGNEEEVGQAIKKQRPDLYITTKWSGRKSMNESLHDSLNWLGVDAVDLYLIHAPRVAGDDVAETWRDFLKLKADGFTKSAGVSNFGIEHLKQIKHAGLEMVSIFLLTAKLTMLTRSHRLPSCLQPVANQILLHPYVPFEKTKALLDYHNKHNIVTEAYSTLWPLTHNPEGQVTQVLDKIAEKHQVQPDQVLFSWARAKGAVVVTCAHPHLDFFGASPLHSLTCAPLLSHQHISSSRAPGRIPRRRRPLPLAQRDHLHRQSRRGAQRIRLPQS